MDFGLKVTAFLYFFRTAIHSFVTGEPRDFIFGTSTYHSTSIAELLVSNKLTLICDPVHGCCAGELHGGAVGGE